MSLDAMKQALEVLNLELPIGSHIKLKNALRAAIEQTHGDWDEVETLRASLREHMAEIQRLRSAIEQPKLDGRTLYKMKQAMTKEHWRSIDPQWKDDPELCHALGYEAGYNDAVARRVEPRLDGSGAGFESLPASPKWQGLTNQEALNAAVYVFCQLAGSPEEQKQIARDVGKVCNEPNSALMLFAATIEELLEEKNR